MKYSYVSAIVLSLTLISCNKKEQEVQVVRTTTKYPISKKMSHDTKAQEQKPAPDFRVNSSLDHNKSLHEKSLHELSKTKPVVLLFIKKDCPCCGKAQPIYNNLAKNFKEKVHFLGIIDTDQKNSNDFIQLTKLSFPLISDPTKRIIRDYKVERALYTVVVNQAQKIEKVWPGYSSGMMFELNSLLAKLTHSPETLFDPQYAPKTMTSGCLMEENW